MELGRIQRLRGNTKAFLTNGLSHFNRSDLPSKKVLFETGATFLFICILSVLFYIGAKSLSSRPILMHYLMKACEEGVSVYFWNILASFGFMLLGLVIVFPVNILANASSVVLSSINSVSAIMFGLLVGQVIYGVSALTAELGNKIWGWGLVGVLLGIILFFFMAFVWIASYLPTQPSFLGKVRQTHLAIRIPVGVSIFILPIVWAYCQG